MQETQLQQKEILAEKKENISKKSMHKKIILISFISILGIFLLIVGFYVGSKYSLRDSSDPVKLSFENIGKLATQSAPKFTGIIDFINHGFVGRLRC